MMVGKTMKLKNISSNTKIRHRHEVNHTFSRLSLAARRIVFMALAQIDSKKIPEKNTIYKISASEYANIANIDISVAYKQLKEGAEHLQSSVLSIPEEQIIAPFVRAGDPLLTSRKKRNRAKDYILKLNITEMCGYTESEGYIEVMFSRSMEPYICHLVGGYTTQVLLSAARLSDTNSSMLYQFLRKMISSGKQKYFIIDIDDLKDELGFFKIINNEKIFNYPEFRDFSRDFLKKSIKQILINTEFDILDCCIYEKIGRKAKSIKFTYSFKEIYY